MGDKTITVKWEDGDVEEFSAGKGGRGAYALVLDAWRSLILDPKETPAFADPGEMLTHLEAAHGMKGEVVAHSDWPEAPPRSQGPGFVD